MIRRRRRQHDGTEVALANFALTFAKALLVLCVALFLLMNPQQGEDGSKPKAEYLIEVEWSGTVRNDVDIWTRTADGHRVSFNNRESGVVFLERDDLGSDCIIKTVNGGMANTCQEITVIRGIVPGIYQVAVHLFSSDNSTTNNPVVPVEVSIKIEKLNPTTRKVWQGQVTLTRVREERPVVQFAIAADGTISDFTRDDIQPIVYQEH